jgi:hypothetical protein
MKSYGPRASFVSNRQLFAADRFLAIVLVSVRNSVSSEFSERVCTGAQSVLRQVSSGCKGLSISKSQKL